MLANAYFVNIPTSGGGSAWGDNFPEIDELTRSSLSILKDTFPFEKICDVHVTGSMTVGELKERIMNKTFLEPGFDLYYNGAPLKDNRKLWTYYIRCDGQLIVKYI